VPVADGPGAGSRAAKRRRGVAIAADEARFKQPRRRRSTIDDYSSDDRVDHDDQVDDDFDGDSETIVCPTAILLEKIAERC
jgi:hypothetical protein